MISLSAESIPERQTWIFEQLAIPPLAVQPNSERVNFFGSLSTQVDTLHFQVGGIIDLGYFEIQPRYSQRAFPGFTPRGRELKTSLTRERQTLGLEIGRAFASPQGHYGKLGVEILHFRPSQTNYLRLGTDASILPNVSVWSIRISTGYFLSFPRGNDYLNVQAEGGRALGSEGGRGLLLGAFAGWTSRMREINTPGVFEHMLFSLGPQAIWKLPTSELRLRVAMRVFLDKAYVTPTEAYYPSDVTAPDFSLSWTQAL